MKFFTYIAFLFLGPLAFASENFQATGKTHFLAVGKPSMLKIHGEAPVTKSKLLLANNSLSGKIDLPLEKLDTGIALRNKHMQNYLGSSSHPTATLTLEEASVGNDFSKSLSNPEQPFRGKLSLHGKEQAVSGKYSIKNGVVSSTFQIKLTDYGIEIPRYLGITVAETVDVNAELTLQKE